MESINKVRGFERALRKVGDKLEEWDIPHMPISKTSKSAGYDMCCAETVVIKSMTKQFVEGAISKLFGFESGEDKPKYAPTLIHTGIKAYMKDDEVLKIYVRSSSPRKVGIVMANSVGIIDGDYYGNPDNDGEIGLLVYNLFPWDIEIKAGEDICQGIFQKYLPADGESRINADRLGGFGSTGKN